MNDGAMKVIPIWHDGEKRIQASVGVVDRMAFIGPRAIRDRMPEQHRAFFTKLPFIIVGSVDPAGDAWATVLTGTPGFLSSASPFQLEIQAPRTELDPANAGMRAGDAIGLLGIELSTRRRNRLNGIVDTADGEGLTLSVDQSFGNCPQYIQLRDYSVVKDPSHISTGGMEDAAALDLAARRLIEAADTFFVASYVDREDRRQVDVSHRGGKAGFVRVAEDGTLTVPDFAGNLFFSTLGNILINGKAGLIFIDFATGDLLQITGEAEVILDAPEIALFQGAERVWRLRPTRVVRRFAALDLRWSFRPDGWSPNSLMTGDWTQVTDRLHAEALAGQWRPFRVSKVVDESRSIRSFFLHPEDGFGLSAFEAGQHIPARTHLPDQAAPSVRSYSLSVAPSDGVYRISVKREGLVSRYLYDTLHVGDRIEVGAPAGAFTIDTRERRPAVMIGAGIGVTPLMSMLRHLVFEGLRTREMRPTYFFQSARSHLERPFKKELQALEDHAQGALQVVRVLSQVEGAEAGVDYDARGRISAALLADFLPFSDFDAYLCGPAGFMQDLYEGLRAYPLPDARIHAESFGASALKRRDTEHLAAPEVSPPPSTQPVPVAFTVSRDEACWTPGSGTLLELAEAQGLKPDFSCRVGTCGTCRTRLLAGIVTYVRPSTAPHAPDEVLICCAVPAEVSETGIHRLQLAL